MDIPDELVAAIASGNAVLFVGAGLSVGAGLPGWGQLIGPLADRIGLPASQSGDPLQVAQFYENQRGRQALISYIHDQIDTAGKQPTANHRRLARLGIRTWLTTNFDDLLEQTLREAGERVSKIVRDHDLPYAGAERMTLIKLHGDSGQPETIVITRQDYNTYGRRFPRVKEKLSGLLVDRTFLFVGYSVSDPDFNQLLDEVGFDLQQHRRMAYAVLFDADRFTIDDLRSRHIQVLNIPADVGADRSAQLGVLLDALVQKVEQVRHPAAVAPIPSTPTPSPPATQVASSGSAAAAAPQDGYTYDAFISYNQQDSDWVENVVQPLLERAGLRLCLPDRDFAIGVPRIINMENAVARSRRTLLILTPNWSDGQWSEFQGLLAQTGDPIGLGQRVLPVIVRPVALPARLGYLTPLDLTNAAKFDRQIQRLIDTIRADSAGAPAASPPGQAAPPPQSAPQRLAPAGGDGRLDYERGLRVLEQYVPDDGANDWKDFNLFKDQLASNLTGERRYGSTESTRAERARIVDQLNPLALRLAGLSFTDLCLGKTLAR
jgi:hypothetical protein